MTRRAHRRKMKEQKKGVFCSRPRRRTDPRKSRDEDVTRGRRRDRRGRDRECKEKRGREEKKVRTKNVQGIERKVRYESWYSQPGGRVQKQGQPVDQVSYLSLASKTGKRETAECEYGAGANLRSPCGPCHFLARNGERAGTEKKRQSGDLEDFGTQPSRVQLSQSLS